LFWFVPGGGRGLNVGKSQYFSYNDWENPVIKQWGTGIYLRSI